MIPILYEKNEEYFTSNGLGRLRDCISCTVTEERNGIYECDFEYPVTGYHYELIQLGRIIGVEHDQAGDVQPFDIVSCSRTLEGVVSFHAVHISYRLSHIICSDTNIQSLQAAFNKFTSLPYMPFTFSSDMASSSGYVAAFDGVPRSVKEILGGMDGSILDTFHGEYKWDKFNVALYSARGSEKNITIRYGVNLLDYSEDLDYSGAFTKALPYWSGNDTIVKGAYISSGLPSYNGRDDAVSLDLTDRFETEPSGLTLTAAAIDYMRANNTNLPAQNITVNFAMLKDITGDEDVGALANCSLCDTIKVVFPRYNMNGKFKIVKTVYDVLLDKYDEMELGTLSTTLSQAMGISSSSPVTESVIGQYLTHIPAAKSCASGRWYQVAYLTLPAGVWLIDCNAMFPATNTSGTRQIRVSTATSGYDDVTTAPSAYGNITLDILMGANTAQYPQAHFPVSISEQTTFRLIAYQGSGSTMNVTGRMYAVRIK